MKKTAVILFNLGGPDGAAAVKPFLQNLFGDPAIIRLPFFLRYPLARLIAIRREKKAAGIYAKIGGGSPILANTEKQTTALEKLLAADGVKCFTAMRYWHPFAEDVVRKVKDFAPDRILLLPLYPQYSTTTSASSISSWGRAAQRAGLDAPVQTLCCYPESEGFIAALSAPLCAAYEKAKAHGKPLLLFSAHGLPEKIVASGDPYQHQCGLTAKALAEKCEIDPSEWSLCYQSRVGPLKWIGPSTEEEIARAGVEKRPVVIVPMAFVSEHSETLFEIDILYRELAAEKGVPYFDRVQTVGTAPVFIEDLAALVRKVLAQEKTCMSGKGGRICPNQYSGCAMTGKEKA